MGNRGAWLTRAVTRWELLGVIVAWALVAVALEVYLIVRIPLSEVMLRLMSID